VGSPLPARPSAMRAGVKERSAAQLLAMTGLSFTRALLPRQAAGLGREGGGREAGDHLRKGGKGRAGAGQAVALRIPLRIFQPACPGSRHSQKFQPLTGLVVIDIAAAEGESYFTPFRVSAPPSTRAR